MDLRLEKIINVRKDGNIYQGKYMGHSVIIKESLRCNPCLDYEYLIGLEINKIKEQLPFFAHTYELIKNPDRTLLIVEYVKGDNINGLPTTTAERIVLLNIIFCVLYRAQEINGFNHNDLHLGNIIFYPLDDYKQFDFIINGKEYSFISKWSFTIIDFGMSSVLSMRDFIPPGTLWGGGIYRVNLGIAPSVFDPLGDFMVVMMNFPLPNYFNNIIIDMASRGQRNGKESQHPGYMELFPINIIYMSGLIAEENRSPIYYVNEGLSSSQALRFLSSMIQRQREYRETIFDRLSRKGYNRRDLEDNLKYYKKDANPKEKIPEDIKNIFTLFDEFIYPIFYRLKFYIVERYTLTPQDIIETFYHLSRNYKSHK